MKPRLPASKYKKFIEFVEFLKANNAISYFNFVDDNVFSEEPEQYWIVNGFTWIKSGNPLFWDHIDDKWRNKLQREQNK